MRGSGVPERAIRRRQRWPHFMTLHHPLNQQLRIVTRAMVGAMRAILNSSENTTEVMSI